MTDYALFTSESVSEGHPDKLADQISDAVLDAAIRLRADSRMACEVLLANNVVVVAGEAAEDVVDAIDYERVARKVIQDVGYTGETGIDPETCEVQVFMHGQEAEIRTAVDEDAAAGKEQGAGDQGMMFGYAADETDVLMPAPITFAHRLMRRHAHVRRQSNVGTLLRPDAKCQLSFAYENGQPTGIKTVVLSTQHAPDVSNSQLTELVMEELLKPVLPRAWFREDTKCWINPSGSFTAGGPAVDTGLTGRKIIVDTYGGMAHHGGGAFSGKDPSKVDRSAAYATRYAAKNAVAAGLARKLEIQVSYAIGQAEPTSVSVNTFGTHAPGLSDEDISDQIQAIFDWRPRGLIDMLDLHRPIYRQTATFGHFGHEDGCYTWENTDRRTALEL